ncbi:hypothetical protein B0H12DRAFT_1113257 [Mycena haematopus]|nr:hypothetical protein B0H12DRAFT_1113257 [Mycena haematopus]
MPGREMSWRKRRKVNRAMPLLVIVAVHGAQTLSLRGKYGLWANCNINMYTLQAKINEKEVGLLIRYIYRRFRDAP